MRTRTGSLALLLALVTCAPAGGQDAPGAPLFGAADVDALSAKAAAANAAAAGLRLERPVPALLLTTEQARERRKAFAASLPADSGVTAAVDLMADFVFSETLLGRYLPDERVLYVNSDVLERLATRGGRPDRRAAEDLLFAVLAHELTHAYDDQVFHLVPQPSELAEVAADPARLLALQARMVLLEGRATWVAELACREAGRPPLEPITLDDARSTDLLPGTGDEGVATAMGRGFVNVLGRAKLVQYAYGREFARRAWGFGGEKFFAEVVAHMPSLDELQDFERYRQRWAREKLAELEAQPAEADG